VIVGQQQIRVIQQQDIVGVPPEHEFLLIDKSQYCR
jgi:hypothetical protein